MAAAPPSPALDPVRGDDGTLELSTTSRTLFTLGLPAAFAGLAYASPAMAAIAPILAAPTALAAWQVRRLQPKESGNFNTTTWTYIAGGLFGPPLAAALQIAVCVPALKLMYGAAAGAYMREFGRHTLEGVSAEIIAQRRTWAREPRHFAMLALLAFPLAGVLEELFKYTCLRLAIWRNKPKHEWEYLIYATAAGIGFATIENFLFVHAGIKGGETSRKLALTIAERTIFGIIGHGATAAITGLRSVHRDARKEEMSVWQVIVRAALYHGVMDFGLFSLSAWNGNVGWIHSPDLVSNIVGYTFVFLLQGSLVRDLWQGIRSAGLHACS